MGKYLEMYWKNNCLYDRSRGKIIRRGYRDEQEPKQKISLSLDEFKSFFFSFLFFLKTLGELR